VLARSTRQVIRQNLIWAAAYNLIAIPIAAFGFMPPWVAALGMASSSTLVMLNATRLLRAQLTTAEPPTVAPGQPGWET
jgi:Cu2+-exporting ATPase